MIAKAYAAKLFKLPILITRFANIYGPGQLNFTALIPDAIKSCITKNKFTIRSNGESIRDFVYIDDIVNLYKLLAENLYKNPKKFSGEVFNAGTNIRHKIKDIIKEIFTYGKKNKELKEIFIKMHKNKTSGELVAQYMDYEKLNNYLGWKPKFKFSNTLPDLFNWYKKYFKKK